MSDSDSAVLAQLRTMNARFATIEGTLDTRLAESGQRSESIIRQLEEIRFQGTYALGMLGEINLKTRQLETRQSASEARHKRADDAIRELERRLGKLEKPDP